MIEINDPNDRSQPLDNFDSLLTRMKINGIMQVLSRTEFKRLSELIAANSVSIYLPTHVRGAETQQDTIRLKNLLSEAEDKLTHLNVPPQDTEAILASARSLLENENFWRHQNYGLALFLSREMTHVCRLPLPFEPFVAVSDRFHLKPLLPLFCENQYFYLLALSQNQVRFFQATRYEISEISLADVPTSLAAALQYDDPEKQLQYHSGSSSGSQPIYHGQGVGQDDDKTDIKRFLTKVEKELRTYLNNETAPLVVAAVDYIRALYEEVNTYPHLLSDGISGNPDVTSPSELQESAWVRIIPLMETSRQKAVSQYQALKDTDKADNEFSHIVAAAERGQIDTLFVLANASKGTQLDNISEQTEVDLNLLDLATVHTFLQDGTVHLLDAESMPDQVPVAAIYRYEIPAEVWLV